jgi:hypothetical protein
MGSELMLEPSFARQSGPYCDSEYELKRPFCSKDDRKLRRPRKRRDLSAASEIPSVSAASC